jgi:hypothetical protein
VVPMSLHEQTTGLWDGTRVTKLPDGAKARRTAIFHAWRAHVLGQRRAGQEALLRPLSEALQRTSPGLLSDTSGENALPSAHDVVQAVNALVKECESLRRKVLIARLPPGWRMFHDARTGLPYYVSPNGVSMWQMPTPPPDGC